MIKNYFRTAWISFTTIFLCAFLFNAKAQTVKVPSDPKAWDTIGVTPVQETYKGKECLLIKSGAIIVKDANLRGGYH